MNFVLKLASAVLVATLVSGFYLAREIRHREDEIVRLKKEVDGSRSWCERMRSERDEVVRREREKAKASVADIVPDSGDDAYDARMRSLLQRVYQLKRQIDKTPEQNIPEFRFLDDSQWLEIAADYPEFKNSTDFGLAVRRLRHQAQYGFLNLLVSALDGYLQDMHGVLPRDVFQLAPYFVHPVSNVLLARYEMASSGNATDVAMAEAVLREKGAPSARYRLDTVRINNTAVRITSQFDLTNYAPNSEEASAQEYMHAVSEYQYDHDGKEPKDIKELLPYLHDPAVLEKFKQIPDEGFEQSAVE